jgi:glycosyltransferase involved in cell wall biosynthesis
MENTEKVPSVGPGKKIIGFFIRGFRRVFPKLIRQGFSKFKRRYGHIINNYYFALRSKLYTRNDHIDVCISHDTFALNAAVMAANRHKAKIVYDAVEIPLFIHRSGKYLANNMSKSVMRLINEVIEPRIISRVDLLIANSPGHQKWHHSHYSLEKMPELVTNARPHLDFERNYDIRRDANISPDEKLLLFIGNANPGYGLEELICSLPMLSENVHLALLGYIPETYKNTIEELVSSLELECRFHVLKPVEYKYVPEYASGADIGVIGLQRNVLNMQLCLPNRFFDYVMARLPIASSRIPSIVEYMDRYDIGTYFDENSPEDIARSIKALLQEEKINERHLIREEMARDLSWEVESKKLSELFQKLLPEKQTLSICIFARKNIWRTNRIVRIAEHLQSQGHQVTVVSPIAEDNVSPELKAKYIVIDDGRDLLDKTLKIIRKVTLWGRDLLRKLMLRDG